MNTEYGITKDRIKCEIWIEVLHIVSIPLI